MAYDRMKYQRMPPEQWRAYHAVARALRGQVLMRPSACGQCGSPCKPDAHHHNGYAPEHWLDVEWLCRNCHERAHHGDHCGWWNYDADAIWESLRSRSSPLTAYLTRVADSGE